MWIGDRGDKAGGGGELWLRNAAGRSGAQRDCGEGGASGFAGRADKCGGEERWAAARREAMNTLLRYWSWPERAIFFGPGGG